MANYIELICIADKYYFGAYSERVVEFPELEVNKKYIGRTFTKQKGSNVEQFYELQDIKTARKLFRKELFKTVIELRDDKLEELLCD